MDAPIGYLTDNFEQYCVTTNQPNRPNSKHDTVSSLVADFSVEHGVEATIRVDWTHSTIRFRAPRYVGVKDTDELMIEFFDVDFGSLVETTSLGTFISLSESRDLFSGDLGFDPIETNWAFRLLLDE